MLNMVFCISNMSYEITSVIIIEQTRYIVNSKYAIRHIFLERRNMFIEKLEKILREKNLTMNKLAKAIGYSQSATSRWKQGRMPQIDILQKICKYLNVSADYLLDLDETPPPILTDQEQELLEHFRSCSPGEQESILLLAEAGAAKAIEQERSLNLENIG